MGEGLGQWEGSLFGWQKQLRPGCGSLSAYRRRGLGRGPRAVGRAEQGGGLTSAGGSLGGFSECRWDRHYFYVVSPCLRGEGTLPRHVS